MICRQLSSAFVALVAFLTTSCAFTLRESPVTKPAPPVAPAPPSSLGPPEGGRGEYSSRAEPGAAVGEPAAVGVLAEVQGAGRSRGLELDADGRLARLAAWFAVATQRIGGSPSLEAVDFATRHLGMIEPLPALLVTVQRPDGSWHPALDSLFEHAPQNIRYNRVGVAVQRVGGSRVAGVALASSHVDTSFLARSLAPGTQAWFEGQLDRGYHHPELAVTSPDGSTRRVALGARRAFSTKLDFSKVGSSQVELLATGPSGLEVVANFPVYVGAKLPDRVALARDVPESADASVTTLLDLVNAERKRAGLRPLRFDPRLATVASAHSADMAEQRFFGHESPTRGDPVRRARSAGLVVKQLGENVGRGPSARELHHLLMGSPGHRGNILRPEFTHIGIGVVLQLTGGERVLLATQLFAALPRKLPPPEFRSALLELVNQSRTAQKTPPLEVDAELDRWACAGSETSGAEPAPLVRTVIGSASDPEDAARVPALYAPGARRVGVCIEPGAPGGLASRTIVIVVSAGYP